MDRYHRIEEAYKRFSSHLAGLQRFGDLATSSGIRHEELVIEAFQELSSGKLIPDKGEGDAVLALRSRSYVVEVKSLQGPCTEAPLHQLARYIAAYAGGQDGQLVGLAIINPFRGVPLLERKEPFSPKVLALARDMGIVLRSTTALLQALNRPILGQDQASVLEEFLQSDTRQRQPAYEAQTRSSKQNSVPKNTLANTERTSKKAAKASGSTLGNAGSGKDEKAAAGSSLAHHKTDKVTSPKAAKQSSKVLKAASSSKKEKTVVLPKNWTVSLVS